MMMIGYTSHVDCGGRGMLHDGSWKKGAQVSLGKPEGKRPHGRPKIGGRITSFGILRRYIMRVSGRHLPWIR